MAERTFKTAGWQAQARPAEGRELIESRQLIREVIFSLYREKAELLAKMGMPSQPIHLSQIFKEIESRIALRRSCGCWPHPHHEKRWWDRRVNETACPTYYADGVPKIVSASAGLYMPNPLLFAKTTVEVST
jgi:hypothetical protein